MPSTWEQNPPLTRLVVALQQSWKIAMPTQQERRDSERVPCPRAHSYELAKLVDGGTLKFSEGSGYAINRNVGGRLLLLPEAVDQRQVFEIQLPSKARKEQTSKLVEVCWTRPISVDARVKMYLVGTRFLFEFPVPS